MQRFLTVILPLMACLAAPTWAATQCPQHFAAGVAPTVTNPKLQARLQEICFEAFATLHSGISRTPMYSAEHLLRANLDAAKALSRKDAFHPIPRRLAISRQSHAENPKAIFHSLKPYKP